MENWAVKEPLPTKTRNKYILMVINEHFRFPFIFLCPDVSIEMVKCLLLIPKFQCSSVYPHDGREVPAELCLGNLKNLPCSVAFMLVHNRVLVTYRTSGNSAQCVIWCLWFAVASYTVYSHCSVHIERYPGD